MAEVYTLYGISYISSADSNATLLTTTKQVVGQTALPETQKNIDDRSFPLSTRNGANAYIIPTDAEKVYLNFIAQKTYISTKIYQKVIQPDFEYFLDEVEPTPDPFVLADGVFFRLASDVPMQKEAYAYYIIDGGVGKKIPDYKTLEVMLADRNQNLLSVRVLEKGQFNDIPKESKELPSKESQWKQDFADATSVEVLKNMQNEAKSAGAMVESAKAEVQKQVDAVKAQAEAAQKQAEAEKAKADAAKAEADAAKAQADAAKAEAAQKQAEAEAAKAQYESKGT